MTTTRRPDTGERLHMASMGDDVRIEIDYVCDDQPLIETDEAYIINDQYDNEHIAWFNVEVWSTVTVDELSEEGRQAWYDRDARGYAAI